MREADEELRFHIELRAAELRTGGMSAAEADAEARRLFGDTYVHPEVFVLFKLAVAN